MRVIVAGASGLIGSALVQALTEAGDDVRTLVRRPVQDRREVFWEPGAGRVDRRGLAGVDAVVNFAGENLAEGRWTPARRERIRQSRVAATRTLVDAMAALSDRPAVLVNASAVGIYGDRGDTVITEAAPAGAGFLAEVCRAWEAEAALAEGLRIRTVMTRFGVVLAPEGGALAKMLPVFRLGGGGRLGRGRQWMSWVTRADAVAAVRHALTHESVSGPVNVTAPHPVTNAEFTRELGRTVRRPALLPVPRFALRAVLGRGMADEALLASTRALPEQLERSGFRFQQPELSGALRSLQL